jgi:hypothetical protein
MTTRRLYKNYFPKIDTGSKTFKNSKFYSLIETSPRILGAVTTRDAAYVAYNYWDDQTDRIYFCISKVDLVNHKWVEVFRTPPLDVSYFALGNGGKLAIYDDKLFLRLVIKA